MIDLIATFNAARLAQAAYIMDDARLGEQLQAMGHTLIDQYADRDSQAMLSIGPDGSVHLSLSGTRFSDHKIGDLIDDMDLFPVDVGNGAAVTHGPYESAAEIWEWARRRAPSGAIFNVCGHSLGGWRCSYTPLFVPSKQIGTLHAFEPPKGANAKYYKMYEAELAEMVIVGNSSDVWFGYPRLGGWLHRPGPMLWLRDDGYRVIDTKDWPGGFDFSDHSIDLVVDRLARLTSTLHSI